MCRQPYDSLRYWNQSRGERIWNWGTCSRRGAATFLPTSNRLEKKYLQIFCGFFKYGASQNKNIAQNFKYCADLTLIIHYRKIHSQLTNVFKIHVVFSVLTIYRCLTELTSGESVSTWSNHAPLPCVTLGKSSDPFRLELFCVCWI